MIRVENISKRFLNVQALRKVSFDLFPGEILGLLGPNGAGKTTAVRIVTGFFPPSEGRVTIQGHDLFENPKEIKRQIGYMPENINLYDEMQVLEFLQFVAAIKGVKRKDRKAHLDEVLERCGLENVRYKLIQFLSKGYRQRAGLAQALVGDPKVLVLDEPTNGLDPEQIIEIRHLIEYLGKDKSVILCSHILPEVSMVCDRVLILKQGQVVASGTPDELESRLKNKQEIIITIGDPLRGEEAYGLLTKIDGVEQMRIVSEKENSTTYALTVSAQSELRAKINQACVQKGIPVLEIRAERLSLEEVFMQIVLKEENS